jgi:predicted pyridoxine 5'-phosphate oxidase superfamily flavin-nucleotide-binding protein
MLSAALQDFVNDWRLGHLATVGPDGPNVSPKGTFQALDATRIAFAEIRSPQTMANLAHDTRVEVNMVDVFSRKGARFRGTAAFHAKQSAEAAAFNPRWTELFGPDLMDLCSGFVVIELTSAKPLTTPAYDVGATECALRQDYLARFTAMQTAWLTAQTED